ncbi:MAG: response regulator [Phormidesmis sp.]
MQGSRIASDLEEKIQTYREQQFTGFVKVNSPNGQQWYIYCLLGRIVWIKSRTHSLRRWQRHLAIHSPAFFEQITQSAGVSYESWNYTALARLVKLKQFRRDHFSKIVESCIAEDLFDILQVSTAQQEGGQLPDYRSYAREAATLPFIMLQQELAWQEAQREWQTWEQAGLAKFSPDWAPVIARIDALKEQTPAQTFQTLTTFVTGNNTLRDLAIRFKQPIVPLAKSILPYVSRQILGLTEIPDVLENADDGFHPELTTDNSSAMSKPPRRVGVSSLQENAFSQTGSLPNSTSTVPLSVEQQRVATGMSSRASIGPSLTAKPSSKVKGNAPRIVYIDDSPADSRAMSEVVESLGYQYTNIPDPLLALPMLIELKPKLIFLDLVMPIANGYEVCSQIRRISAFKEIPVVIVTSNDGIADRVRAKLVGASGFLGKPIQHEKVSKVLKKHLRAFGATS